MKKVLSLCLLVMVALVGTAFADDEMGFDFNLHGNGEWDMVNLGGNVDGFAAGYASGDYYFTDSTSNGEVDLSTVDNFNRDPKYWASADYHGRVVSGAWSSGYDGEGSAVTAVFIDAEVELTVDLENIDGHGHGTYSPELKDEEPEYEEDEGS